MPRLGLWAGACWGPSVPPPFYLSHSTPQYLCLCPTHLSVCVSLSHSLKTKKWVNEVR